MRKVLFFSIILLLVSCKKDDEVIEYGALHWQVTMLLPDNGLGDEGLFDRSFEGVVNFVDKVGNAAVDLVLKIPYDAGDSDANLKNWIATASTTTVNHRLLFCPMPSTGQCDMLAAANLADGDEVLVVCDNGEIANKLQSTAGIANDSRFHIYILDLYDAGEQAGYALATAYKSSQAKDTRKCAAILTTKAGMVQNGDLIDGFKAAVKRVTGEEAFVSVTEDNADSAFRQALALAKDYACILPATYYSNYGIYCALMGGISFHTVKMDGVVTPTSTLEDIIIDRGMKQLANTLLTEWRYGGVLEHIKTTTIQCEQ